MQLVVLEYEFPLSLLVHNPSVRRSVAIAGRHPDDPRVDIAAPLGISVHDHIIVGKNGHASLKACG